MARQTKIVQHHPNYIAFGGHYIRCFIINGFPTAGIARTFESLWNNQELIDLGVHIRLTNRLEPTRLKWNTSLKWKYRRLHGSVREAQSQVGEVARIEEVKALEALEDIRQKVTSDSIGDKHLFDMWNVITITAISKQDLDKATDILQKYFNVKEYKLNKHNYEQAECFQASGWVCSSGPSQIFLKNHYGRLVDKDAIGSFFPFYFGSNSDENGIYNGHRVADGVISLIDTTLGAGQHNFLVCGGTGEGKSVFLKDASGSFYDEGFRVFIFDVDGEYRKKCEDVKGLWIDHTMQSGSYHDPSRILSALGIPEHDLNRCRDAIDGVARTISLLAGEIDSRELNAIDRATLKLFNEAGIDIDDNKTWDRVHAGIHGWYMCLKKDTSPGAVDLVEKIWRYFEGSMKRMFGHEEKDDRISKADYIVFHIGQGIDNDADAHTAMVKLNMAFSAVWAEIKKERAKGEKWSVVLNDELQRSLSNPHFARFQNQVVTTIRKYNGVWMGGLNNPAVMWPEPTPYNQDQVIAGSAIWENTKYKVLFWMEESGIKTLAQKSDLPKPVISTISTLQGTNQYVFRKGIRNYDLLKKIIPPSEISRGLYKTRGLRDSE